MSGATRRRGVDIWPGFVDALAALLMVLVFVLMIFTLGQFFLTDALSGRDRALSRLNAQVAELADLLSLEQQTTQNLRQSVQRLQASLADSEQRRQQLGADLAAANELTAEQDRQLQDQASQLANLSADIEILRELRTQLEQEVAQLASDLEASRRDVAVQTELSSQSQAQVLALNRQIKALRDQLAAISSALQLAESGIQERDQRIEELGRRLNLAMAEQVIELAEYRSEFFGRLKQVLGENPDLRIEGDRFVFQSELLFATGSAELGDQGRAQVRGLVNTLNEIARRIPSDLDWVLRIDGHTDRRPIATPRFPSNWELSTARALAIVKYMTELGVDARHLAATGFGENHPLDDRANELAYARNRRIELKLTSR